MLFLELDLCASTGICGRKRRISVTFHLCLKSLIYLLIFDLLEIGTCLYKTLFILLHSY